MSRLDMDAPQEQQPPKKPLKFIHITKTAGSSIEEQGKKHKIQWGIFHKEYGFHHEYFPRKPAQLKEKYDWFMVVRNPYDRVLSEYHWLCRVFNMKQSPDHFNTFIHKWITNNKLNKVNDRTFGRANGDHFSPQYKYLDPTVSIRVLKFENLKTEFDALMEEYNLPITLTIHTNGSKDKQMTIDSINQTNMELINDYYKQDFELFNYPMIDPSDRS